MRTGAVAAERDGETVDDEAGHGANLWMQNEGVHSANAHRVLI